MRIKSCLVIFIVCVFVCSCADEKVNSIPEVTSILDTDAFDEAKDVEYTLADGFTLDLWAPGPLLYNAVALSFDPSGNAYVSQTKRRKSSDLDIRQHRDWMVEDISLQSIEETRQFHLKKLATALSEENTWLEDFNEDGVHDYRDLEVQSEIISKIYDTDGDGRADASHQYADGINDMLTGVAAGVLYHKGDVFVTAAPHVYRFRDTDDDGDYDTKEIISTGYGVHIAYAGHDMSGLTVGHDGKIYWTIGDLGVDVVGQDGKRWLYPNQGAAMRCNPDGSDFEVYAHGLRNTQEIVFDAYGNLISVDNDGDHPGERERYVHILEGSDTGWRINWQYGKYNEPNEKYKVWMDEGMYLPYFKGQAAYIIPALALAENGPAGIAYNPGTALGPKWNEYFFASYFTGNSKRSRLQAFKLNPKGASFEVTAIQDVINGINSTGINFGPDGALYVNDWKESYDKKDAGRVWKLDAESKNAERSNTANILKTGAKDLLIETLRGLIDHTDMRVRQMAQFELVDRTDSATLLSLIAEAKTRFGKLHAIWGYGQLMRVDKSLGSDLLSLLSNPDEHVKSQIAKVIGDAKLDGSDALLEMLKDPSERVQFFAAEALGKVGGKNAASFDALVKQLQAVGDKDPHHRHAIVYALSKIDDGAKIEKLKDHPSEDVRIGAVVALRELASERVASFLNDQSELVVTEAARAINDDRSIPDAVPALAATLEGTKFTKEAYIRRAINANLRVGDAASANRLQVYFSESGHESEMRTDALWALGSFANPLPLDRVDNRYRELPAGDVKAAKKELSIIFDKIESHSDKSVKAMIIQVAGRLGQDKVADQIFSYVRNASEHTEIRKASLTALGAMNSDKLTEAINVVIEDKDVELRKEAQKILAEAEIPDNDKLQIIEKIFASATAEEKQAALKSLPNISSPKANEMMADLVKNLATLDPGIKLDVMQAAEASGDESLQQLVADYESSKDQSNKLEVYSEALAGGDPQKGRDILAFNEAAQCLRCHQITGYGGEVGPPLDNVGAELSREDLLLSLVDPNARIAPGYGNSFYTLNDGQELSGTVSSQDDKQITVRDVTGKETTFDKSEIKSKQDIPSGMFSQEGILDKSEIRDLVAFLSNLKGDLKR